VSVNVENEAPPKHLNTSINRLTILADTLRILDKAVSLARPCAQVCPQLHRLSAEAGQRLRCSNRDSGYALNLIQPPPAGRPT
jgi:hypothetical protein